MIAISPVITVYVCSKLVMLCPNGILLVRPQVARRARALHEIIEVAPNQLRSGSLFSVKLWNSFGKHMLGSCPCPRYSLCQCGRLLTCFSVNNETSTQSFLPAQNSSSHAKGCFSTTDQSTSIPLNWLVKSRSERPSRIQPC
jgi:hypothetical protein